MMRTATDEVDPLETIISEGGPYHTRKVLKDYLVVLMKTGREDMVRKIIDKNENYGEKVTLEEIKNITSMDSKLSTDSSLGELLSNKLGRKVLEKSFGPVMFRMPQMKQVMGMKLSSLARWMPKILTNEKIKEIDELLKKEGE